MFLRDRFDKMTRKDLEEEIRKFKDFSKFTRKEMEEKLEVLLPEVNLNQFSDQELEDLLRGNYTFSEYTVEELREEARRHENFEDWSREELEKEYEKLEDSKEPKNHSTSWTLFFAGLCLIMGFSYGILKTRLDYYEQQTYRLQQDVELIQYQNGLQEDEIYNLSEIIDMLIDYITFNNYPEA